MECNNEQKNMERCKCTYDGCDKHAICCECLASHLGSKQLPGCCFPPEVERTYDRSFKTFAKAWEL